MESNAALSRDEVAKAYCKRGTLLDQVGKTDEAIADLTEAVRLDPKLAAAYCRRAAIFLAQGFPDLAVDDLTEAMSAAPNSQEAACLRARACWRWKTRRSDHRCDLGHSAEREIERRVPHSWHVALGRTEIRNPAGPSSI